jgi:hypothetical protein
MLADMLTLWMEAHPNGEVEFRSVGEEKLCRIREKEQCYFGHGKTVTSAFGQAVDVYRAVGAQKN